MCFSRRDSSRKTSPTPPATPLSASFSTAGLEDREATASFVRDVLECYTTISSFPDLRPSPKVNEAFEKLVDLCIQVRAEHIIKNVLADPRIDAITPHLQSLCGEGEFYLETFWAEKLASIPQSSSQDQMKTLSLFPYYENYLYLTNLELNAIFSCLPPIAPCPQRFAFIGSGPLPLTSLCFFHLLSSPRYSHAAVVSTSGPGLSSADASQSTVSSPLMTERGIQILNIDRDPTAISCSKALCQSLQYPSTSMYFLCAEAENLTQPLAATVSCPLEKIPSESRSVSADLAVCDLTAFDVVYLAALVGATGAEKRLILRDVVSRMRPGALVVVRSAWGLRGLLYPVVNVTRDLEAEGLLDVLVVVHPYNRIVNSVIVGRVRARAETESGPVL